MDSKSFQAQLFTQVSLLFAGQSIAGRMASWVAGSRMVAIWFYNIRQNEVSIEVPNMLARLRAVQIHIISQRIVISSHYYQAYLSMTQRSEIKRCTAQLTSSYLHCIFGYLQYMTWFNPTNGILVGTKRVLVTLGSRLFILFIAIESCPETLIHVKLCIITHPLVNSHRALELGRDPGENIRSIHLRDFLVIAGEKYQLICSFAHSLQWAVSQNTECSIYNIYTIFLRYNKCSLQTGAWALALPLVVHNTLYSFPFSEGYMNLRLSSTHTNANISTITILAHIMPYLWLTNNLPILRWNPQ